MNKNILNLKFKLIILKIYYTKQSEMSYLDILIYKNKKNKTKIINKNVKNEILNWSNSSFNV